MRSIKTLLLPLLLVIVLAFGTGFNAPSCSPAQKKVVVETSLSGLITTLSRVKNPFAERSVQCVRGYQAEPSESQFQKGLSCFDAIIAGEHLPATILDLITMGRSIFRAFTPSDAATMSGDEARAAKPELEKKFKELNRLADEAVKKPKK